MRLRDIADHFGVSEMTVSRAFNHPQRVDPELRQRILDYAAEVGYQPDIASRSLAARRQPEGQRRTGRIVLLLLDTEAALTGDVLTQELRSGLTEACGRASLALEVVCQVPGPALDHAVAVLSQRRDLGGLLIDPRGHDLDGLALPADVPIAVIFDHAGHRPLPCVDIDRSAGVGLVTEALVRSGRQRPGFIALHSVSSFSNHQFIDAFPRAWREAGLTHVPAFVAESWSGLVDWLREHRPDVVVGLTPPITRNLFRDAGWQIPGDVAFVSLDVPPGEETCAGLSCRRQDLARHGLQLLLNHGQVAGSIDTHGLRLLIPPRWRDGATLPLADQRADGR